MTSLIGNRSGITRSAVVATLYRINADKAPVKAAALAHNLRCSEEVVLDRLRELKHMGIVRDYRRKDGRYWGIWR
jgi:Mn-dependent DtxR family transcriptional regulator